MFLKKNNLFGLWGKKKNSFTFYCEKIDITRCGCGELYSAEMDEVFCAMLYLYTE